MPGLPTPCLHAVERASTDAYAILLADTVRARLDAAGGIGESGATGPIGNRYGKAVGHCCIAVTGPVTKVIIIETGAVDRLANIRAFAQAELRLAEKI